MNKLALHIVTWNGLDYLPKLLSSIDNQTFKDFTVRIHDNASSDNSYDLVQSWSIPKGFQVSQSESNLGFSGGHNLLYGQASEPFILLLNQDIELNSDYCEVLLSALEANPQCGALSGVLYRKNDNEIDSAGLKISRNHSVYEIRTEPAENTKEVFGVSAAAGMYRKSALDEVAYNVQGSKAMFSDKFDSYKEDVDLSYRLQLAGWKSAIIKSARAVHVRGMKGDGLLSRKEQKKATQYLSYRNHLLFLTHTAQFNWISYTGISVLVYELAKFVWILVKETGSLKAWKEYWQLRADSKDKKKQVSKLVIDPTSVTRWYGKS